MPKVFPGDELGYLEEFIPSRGVYEDGDKIYSALFGDKLIRDRTISVNSKKALKFVKRGDIVLGVVSDILSSLAFVNILAIENRHNEKFVLSNFIGGLRISDISFTHLKEIRDAIRIGDVLRAKVIDVGEDMIKLTTKSPELGVIRAFCSKCRHPLVLKGKLVCSYCGHFEKRKLSKLYGRIKEVFK